MKRVFIKLATPSVELPIRITDVNGETAKFTAAFKRYSEEGAVMIRKAADAVIEPSSPYASEQAHADAIKAFMKAEILYVKDLTVMSEDELGKPEVFKVVEDSRTETEKELQGETSCLDFLLDMLFASPLWSSALIKAFYSLHYNVALGSDAEVKN
jgi:hypothetical protein